MNSRLPLAILLLLILLGGGALWLFFEGAGGRGLPAQGTTGVHGGGLAGSAPEADLQLAGAQGSSAAAATESSSLRRAEPGAARSSNDHSPMAGPAIGLRGVVLDPAGNPLEGAEVAGRADEGGASFFAVGPEYGQAVRTDSEGRFLLTGMQPGAFKLQVLAAGFAPLVRGGIAIPRDAILELPALRLDRGVVLAGHVLGPERQPIAGAEVYALGAKPTAMGPTDRRLAATTGADGSFRVDQLPLGPWRLLVQSERHPDAILEGESRALGVPTEGLEVLLLPGFSIKGGVQGIPPNDSTPLAIAAWATSSKAAFGTPQRQVSLAPGGSFELGGLAAGETYRLSVHPESADGSSPWSVPLSKPAAAVAGTFDVVVEYMRSSALAFRVVDALSKQPIEGLTVKGGFGWEQPLRDEEGHPIQVFPGGEVRFPGLRAMAFGQSCTLNVSSVGYRDYVRTGIPLGLGQELDLGTIELRSIPVVRVQVTDAATGLPIEAAAVHMRQESSQGKSSLSALGYTGDRSVQRLHAGEESVGRTNAEGLATISSREGEICSIRISAGGFAPKVLRNLQLPLRQDARFEAPLSEGGSVRVRVLRSDGTHAGGLRVTQFEQGADAQDLGWQSAPRRAQVTDAEGLVSFAFLRPGLHRFELDFEGAVHSSWSPDPESLRYPAGVEVQVQEGGAHEAILKAPAACSLAGQVLEGGKPLVGARVRLDALGSDGIEGVNLFAAYEDPLLTDSEGRYRLEEVREGAHELVISHSKRSMPSRHLVELVVGENQADLNLGVAIVEGRVVDPRGAPIEGVRVGVQRKGASDAGTSAGFLLVGRDLLQLEGGQVEPSSTDAEGRYRLRAVEPGVELQLTAQGRWIQSLRSEPFALDEDELRHTDDLVVERAGSVRLELYAKGELLAFGSVSAFWAGDADEAEPVHQMLGGGKGVLEGLRPGPWRLTAQTLQLGNDAPLSRAEVSLEVRAGEEFFQTLQLLPSD